MTKMEKLAVDLKPGDVLADGRTVRYARELDRWVSVITDRGTSFWRPDKPIELADPIGDDAA